MGTFDGLAVLGILIGASAIAVVVSIVRLLKRRPGVPAPWEFPDPFRRSGR